MDCRPAVPRRSDEQAAAAAAAAEAAIDQSTSNGRVARDLCLRTSCACVVGRRAVFSYDFDDDDGCMKARFTQLQYKLLVTTV